ncbi:MAG: dihydrofolate reductase [Paenibacillaceae bacterium]
MTQSVDLQKPSKGLSLIWAMGHNQVIGINNKLPWRLPAELAYFKKVTMGHPIIMGRRTFESIGRPLPGRTNIVLTRDHTFTAEGTVVLHSVEQVLEQYNDAGAFVIGGTQIYRQFFPVAERLYITMIDHEFEGDEYFPEIDWSKWCLVNEESGVQDEKNPYSYSFKVFDRV